MPSPLKPLSLLLLRLSLAWLTIVWALIKVMAPDRGVGLSEKYYMGVFSMEWLQMGWGVVQLLAAALVILGLFRRVSYAFMLLVHGFTMIVVSASIALPFVEGHNLLFVPSLTVAFAALVMLAFLDEDRYALDRALFK